MVTAVLFAQVANEAVANVEASDEIVQRSLQEAQLCREELEVRSRSGIATQVDNRALSSVRRCFESGTKSWRISWRGAKAWSKSSSRSASLSASGCALGGRCSTLTFRLVAPGCES
eukprot:310360-Rhodomonas_salina.3